MSKHHQSLGIYGYPKSGNTLANRIVNAINMPPDEKVNVYDMHVVLRSNLAIPKHGYLDYIVFKSHSSAPSGGGLNPHDAKSSLIGVGKTTKALLITRNPIDVLFSFINFQRLQSIKRNAVFTKSRFIKDYLGLSSASDYTFFCEQATYENLLAKGSLKRAFHAFSVSGLSIPDLYSMSGTWPSHLLSWTHGGYSASEFLKIRYEDIFLNPSVVVSALSQFLSIEKSDIESAISRVNASARSDSKVDRSAASSDLGNASPSFVNKVMPYYSLQYIEKSLIANFMTRHHGLLKACGYADFLDLLSTI
jgi:hypothetical protein